MRDDDLERLDQLATALSCGLREELAPLLTHAEVNALETRVKGLRRQATMPNADSSWRAIPWPAF